MTAGGPERSDPSRARGPFWRTVKIVLGILLIPIGVVGLFVPVLQGVFLLVLAFALLASEIPFFAKLRKRLKERYPRFFRGHDQD